MLLEGKNAIITGARRGIGRATVEVFAQNGANVWACARKQDDAFEADMERISKQYGTWIKPVYFDATDAAASREAMNDIFAEKKAIHALVNNAGQVRYDAFSMMPEVNLRNMLECNYIAPLLLTQRVVRAMAKNGGGSVIFVTSVSGLHAEVGCTAYGGSKAAMTHATGVLARELAAYNVRVNAIAPGIIDTDMQRAASSEYLNGVLDRVYLKRMGRAKEIGQAAAFLASDLASYITGQVLRVDGGM